MGAKHKTTGWITERTQISEDDRNKVMKMIEDIGKWLDEKEKKQENVEMTDTPAFTSSDVKAQIRPLQRLMGRMLAKKVPEPADPNKKMRRKLHLPRNQMLNQAQKTTILRARKKRTRKKRTRKKGQKMREVTPETAMTKRREIAIRMTCKKANRHILWYAMMK